MLNRDLFGLIRGKHFPSFAKGVFIAVRTYIFRCWHGWQSVFTADKWPAARSSCHKYGCLDTFTFSQRSFPFVISSLTAPAFNPPPEGATASRSWLISKSIRRSLVERRRGFEVLLAPLLVQFRQQPRSGDVLGTGTLSFTALTQ